MKVLPPPSSRNFLRFQAGGGMFLQIPNNANGSGMQGETYVLEARLGCWEAGRAEVGKSGGDGDYRHRAESIGQRVKKLMADRNGNCTRHSPAVTGI